MWNEMATEFDIREYESMEKPVVILVTSCYVTRYNGLKLSGTSATHYYLNPNVAETYQIKQIYVPKAHSKHTRKYTTLTLTTSSKSCRYPMLPNMPPPLEIKNQRDKDVERERTRNRFPLSVLLEVDPQNYQ
ncbi:DNA helicase, partial [Tanacetum coccineum]